MEVDAKELIDIARRLHQKGDGTFPSARAVRRDADERGSSKRAGYAVLAVHIEHGITPHLLHTLPDDFQAEIVVAASPAPPVSGAATGLPTAAQAALQQVWVMMTVAHEKEVASLRRQRAEESARWVAETGAIQAQLTDMAEELDETTRVAEAVAEGHRAERAELREQLALLKQEVGFKEREVQGQQAGHEKEVTTLQDAAQTAEHRLQGQLDYATAGLASETDRCRVAEREVAALTATVTALREDKARLEAELGAQRETARPTVRPRSKAAAV